jgi:thiol-disulfide isomerase/thioredoxin
MLFIFSVFQKRFGKLTSWLLLFVAGTLFFPIIIVKPLQALPFLIREENKPIMVHQQAFFSQLLLLSIFYFESLPSLVNALAKNNYGPRRLDGDLRSTRPQTQTSTALYSTRVKFKNFEEVLDKFQEEPVIFYFSTRKCGPCKLMKTELSTVNKMMGDDFKIFSIDTEKWPHVGARFKIARLPCIVVFRKGEVLLRLEGVHQAEQVVEQVRTLL